MKLAIVYWPTSSVGGIATHLNALRLAAIEEGDTADILTSGAQLGVPVVFPERKWVRGGDTNIWIDGRLPHRPEAVEASLKFLKDNYDAVCFCGICPHETKAYPRPDFLPLFDTKLPKIAIVPDGYWDTYANWAEPLLPKLRKVFVPIPAYASALPKKYAKKIVISPFPFVPGKGRAVPKAPKPLLVWPNQWKNIKGIVPLLGQIPNLPKNVVVELYSSGIRYYQIRTEEVWNLAVKEDKFTGAKGNGRAVYFGNVDRPEILSALQRAWFTVNLQGITSRRESYKKGSYNNTEVEALYYGALPILHSSTLGTILPPEIYLSVDSASEIPGAVKSAISSGLVFNKARIKKAREFVEETHWFTKRYGDLKAAL